MLLSDRVLIATWDVSHVNLDGIAPLRTIPKRVDARCYNTVRLALARRESPLRVELPHLRIEIALDRSCWVGRSLVNGMPLIAWTNFDDRGRALHESVPCQLHLYHCHAGLLMSTALDGLYLTLDQELAPEPRRSL